ncbi:hypothetical protein [Secundilactobacillus collinoides]|uniref:hypothetical protein n=1 Tax=Secundilactobacillus collinoides TaxID=33960 RepID=UPI001379860C|nr:hypothetical protein [Secundilactobacillus collinoides]
MSYYQSNTSFSHTPARESIVQTRCDHLGAVTAFPGRQRHLNPKHHDTDATSRPLPIVSCAKRWLSAYSQAQNKPTILSADHRSLLRPYQVTVRMPKAPTCYKDGRLYGP